MSAISISLIEDDGRAAQQMLALLNQADDVRVLSHYWTAEEALAQLPRLRSTMVLVDLQLPQMGGIECIRRLKRILPGLLCIVLTQFDDSDLLFAALQAGADGYLLKQSSPQQIIEAISTVQDGGGAMSPSICRKVLNHFQNLTPSRDAQSRLTQREIELLQLARRGKRSKEIARAMGLTYETVRTHFRNIYRKLHVHKLHAAVEKTFER